MEEGKTEQILVEDKAERIKEFIRQNKPLVISRVPEKTLETFKKIADENFCSDYGMTLAFLLDKLSEYQTFIENYEGRLLALEKKVGRKEKKEIKLMSGKVIEAGDKNE